MIVHTEVLKKSGIFLTEDTTMFVSRTTCNFRKKFIFIHLFVRIQEWVFDTAMMFCDS